MEESEPVPPVNWETCTAKKAEFVRQTFEDLSPGCRLSKQLWGCTLSQAMGEPGYPGIFATKTRQSEHWKITVNESSALVSMGRCKSLGSLKSFLWWAPQLSGANILLFSILSSLAVHSQGGPVAAGLMATASLVYRFGRWQSLSSSSWLILLENSSLLPTNIHQIYQFSPSCW